MSKTKTPSNVREAFEALLATFVQSTQQSMDAARELANIAIQQFAEHGDLSYAQNFLEAMPKNYIRRVAFLRWLCDHAPVTMDTSTGRLIKDKDPEATPLNVEQAVQTAFWDYAPDPEQINFGANDVVVALRRVTAKFRNKRHRAASDKARDVLAMVDSFVEELESKTKALAGDSTTDDQVAEAVASAPAEEAPAAVAA